MTAGLSRHLRILLYTGGSLRRRWRKNAAVVWVYGLVIFTLASVVFLTQSLTQWAVATLSPAPEMMVQRLSAGRHGLSHRQSKSLSEARKEERMRGVIQRREFRTRQIPAVENYVAEPIQPVRNGRLDV